MGSLASAANEANFAATADLFRDVWLGTIHGDTAPGHGAASCCPVPTLWEFRVRAGMSGYPIELNLNGRTVLVVGLGPVGRRKAEALAAAGARVIGVDPAAGSFAHDLPEGIEVMAEAKVIGVR